MDPTIIAALEATLVLGGALALAIWELLKLRRERRQDAAEARDSETRGDRDGP